MADWMAGSDMRLDVEGVPYKGKRFSLEYITPRGDVTNSEGVPGKAGGTPAPGKGAGIATNRTLRVQIDEASIDMDDNIFENPAIDVPNKDYLDIKIYPAGRDADFHQLTILVDRITHTGEVGPGGLQPVSISGETDGDYFLVGETKP